MVEEKKGTQGNPVGTEAPPVTPDPGKTGAELDPDIKGIMEKYEGNPQTLAKALKETQQGVTKKIEEEVTSRKAAEAKVAEMVATAEKKPEEPIGKDPIAYLEKKYPKFDRETLETIHEISQMNSAFQIQQMQANTLVGRITQEKEGLKDNLMYKHYKGEVDDQLAKMPVQQKMQPGIVKEVLRYIIGKHTMDGDLPVIEGEKKPKEPAKTGGIEGPKPGTPAIGAEATSALTPKQAEEFERLGLAKESAYLDLLKGRKEMAKKNQMPEPELMTDPVYPKT